MKKITASFLGYYWRYSLKNYFQLVCQLGHKMCVCLLLIVLASCGVHNEINTDEFEPIYPHFKARFYDQLDTIRRQMDSQVVTRSLMKDLTQINTIDYSEPISIEIQKETLFLKFQDLAHKAYVIKYYGKMSRKKFVFYTNYETINFPFLYITKEVSKYTVYLSNKDEMIIKDYNENQGMLLFFGAGGSSSRLYKFKLLKNE